MFTFLHKRKLQKKKKKRKKCLSWMQVVLESCSCDMSFYLIPLFSSRYNGWQEAEKTVRGRGSVNRFIEGYFVILSTQRGHGPLCNVFRFSSVIFPLHPPFQSTVPRAQRPSFIQSSCFGEHTVFSRLSCFFVLRLNLASCRTWRTMKPCHSALHDNIKCHVRVHLQNKITAFGGPWIVAAHYT